MSLRLRKVERAKMRSPKEGMMLVGFGVLGCGLYSGCRKGLGRLGLQVVGRLQDRPPTAGRAELLPQLPRPERFMGSDIP